MPTTKTSGGSMEPNVVYADSDDKDNSDSESIYESYPPSEADDIPTFASNIPSTNEENIPTSPNISTQSFETQIQQTSKASLSEEDNLYESDLTSHSQLSIKPSDNDYQKVPRDTAELIQSRSVLPLITHSSTTPGLGEIDTPSRSLTEESDSEGSESVLAESMIFTHEEAGSLYLSALGGSRPFNSALPPLAEEEESLSETSPYTRIPNIMIQKRLLRVDYLDIFIPGIAPSSNNQLDTSEIGKTAHADSMSESVYPSIPGSFSVYAASRPRRKKTNDIRGDSQANKPKPKPNVSFQTLEDSPLEQSQHLPPLTTSAIRTEVAIGNIEISIDLIVGKKIVTLALGTIELLQNNHQVVPNPPNTPPSKDDVGSSNFDLHISLAALNVILVDKMPSRNLETQAPVIDAPNIVGGNAPLDLLTISMSQLTFKQNNSIDIKTGFPQSFSEVILRSCFVKVGSYEVIRFMRNQGAENVRTEKGVAMDSVLVLHVTENNEKRNIHIKSVPMNFYFPTRDLEEMLPHFGGSESFVNLAASPNISSNERDLSNAERRKLDDMEMATTEKETFLTADIAGIIIEVFVSDPIGGVGLSTSPIKVVSDPSRGLSIRIPQLAIFGPDVAVSGPVKSESTLLVFTSIKVGFDHNPSEADLERLLTMITPSMDRYNVDDDLMIDVLLRQRRRGSVFRLDIGNVTGKMSDIGDISLFIAIAEELAKMATVAKYIPQDERPGMLALISMHGVSFEVFAGDELHTFCAKLGALEICHVAAPALLALSIGQVTLSRESPEANETWVGESLPRSLTVSNEKDKNHPMVKVRIIGDELEPEIKIKVWNTRLEYHVKAVLALLSLTAKDTTDVVATNMVNSIAHLAEKEIAKQLKDPNSPKNEGLLSVPPPLRLNIGLSGICIALNPLDSNAKALFLVQDGSFVCELSHRQPFLAALILNKANLVAVDDRNNLTSPQRQQSTAIRKQKYEYTEDLIRYTSQGYVSILTMTSAKVNVSLEDNDIDGEKTMTASVEDVFIVIESCADSTQTVIGILNGMKPPLPESEEIKYMTQIMPVDVFANLDENAFVPMDNTFIGGQPRDLKSLEEIPEDLLEDEIPFNSQLIESYYPSSALPSSAPPSGYEILLTPPTVLNNFHEQVCVVAEEPLNFDEGYFQTSAKDPKEEEATKIIPRKTALRVSVRNTQLIWNLHDGYDWHKTRDAISKAVRNVEERASKRRRHLETPTGLDDMEEDEESATYDVLFNSIYITLPVHRDPKDLSKDIQNQIGGDYDVQSETGSYAPTITTLDSQSPGLRNPQIRKRDQKYRRSQRNAMQFELKGVDVDFTIFAPDGLETQSSLDVRVNDIQVTENVRTSTWRMFLTYMREAGVRERGLPMAHIHLDILRPVPELAATELSIKVKLLPLRLYVDQDALEFLTRFFEFKDPDNLKPGAKVEEPFIQRCEIDTVRVKLDFKPKRVDYAGIRSGKTTEFMNFFILEEADMELRHVALNGVSGFERLGKDLNNIWMPDIKQNQLGGVLAGVAPLRSLVNISTGVRDLVKVPIMEYRKDGRLVRSIKKGTQHFAKTSGSEVARLGAKLAIGTQNFLEKTEEFLVGEPLQPRHTTHPRDAYPGDELGEGGNAVFSPYADQPLGVYRGLVQAKQGFTRNINEAKEAIMRVPSEAAQGGSAKSAAAAVFRAAPTAVIRPMIGVTEAVHKTLHGIDNTIDKEKREKLREKYKR
ncbi:hypothetical protein ABW20_dc0103620 [Dactylellina cionopaga]|nr:hypothetical protein ABW20_dc0103620 [Dactylellina cionopaga]